MGGSRLVIAVLALGACGKSSGDSGLAKATTGAAGAFAAGSGDTPKTPVAPAGSGAVTPAPPADTRGADTGLAASQGLLAAMAAGDKAAARRFVPDYAACAAVPAFKRCPEVVDMLDSAWDQAVAVGADYKAATLTKSDEAIPLPGAELYLANLDGKPPLQFLAFTAENRHFAVVRLADPVKPPSTGNEMPAQTTAMSAAQARQIVDEAVARVEKDQGECEQVVDGLQAALPVAFPEEKVPQEAVPGLNTLGLCATKTARWRAAIGAGFTLLDIAPDDRLPARIVRAIAELGEYDRAINTAKALAKQFPKSGPMLTAALTFVYCRAEQYDACEASANRALADLARAKIAPTDEAVQLNRLLRATAEVVTGHPKDAIKEIAEVGKSNPRVTAAMAQARQAGEQAVAHGFYFEAVPLPQLPIGVYHLMGKAETGALVTIKLREHAGVARTFRIEAEVPGVTERSSNSVSLDAKGSQVLWVAPPLKMDFDPAIIRGPRPAQLALKVIETTKGADRAILDETMPIEVLPRDYLPLRRKVGADSMVPTYGYLGAWITPNDKAVDAFLTEAKARLPGHAFVGEQDATTPQIKALFDALKARGVSYVMDPDVTSTAHFVQRTRLPGEVLASTNAQCLEGTLLFATLMEAIGIKPIIVLVPGHAFVGWHTVAADGTKGDPLFVETTMVGGPATFEQAMAVANKRAVQELNSGAFKSGASTFIDVAQIRAQGFTAQPM
ncbi:MAG: hypothetical protein K8W52_00385 [Deltaproteobacteria bacterium]|nr:hypothetical protein [Deltaproteobacteria bacterium]